MRNAIQSKSFTMVFVRNTGKEFVISVVCSTCSWSVEEEDKGDWGGCEGG